MDDIFRVGAGIFGLMLGVSFTAGGIIYFITETLQDFPSENGLYEKNISGFFEWFFGAISPMLFSLGFILFGLMSLLKGYSLIAEDWGMFPTLPVWFDY